MDSLHSSSASEGRIAFDRQSIVQEQSLGKNESIQDYYELTSEQLGKGSYGSVQKARDRRTGAVRAVKIIKKSRIENITRLKREITIMKKLDHPNIIKLFEVFEDDEHIYLVLELCTGGELFARIIKSGHFSEYHSAVVMKQVLSAIWYCHENGIIHRDLKPENLLYSTDSSTSSIKIIDWGFAAMCSKDHEFYSTVGTPYYVAPQVLMGKYDNKCDLWSAGVILYILLAGYPPFHGKDNQEILKEVKSGKYDFDPRFWGHVSDKAKDLVKRLLVFSPQKRWMVETLKKGEANTVQPTINPLIVENFKAFRTQAVMKQLAITVIAYQLSEKEIQDLHKIFVALDTDGDGVLSSQELRDGFMRMRLNLPPNFDQLVREIDTNQSGKIDYTEFLAAGISQQYYDKESACRAAFRVFDLDGDGKITKEELKQVLGTHFADNFNNRSIDDIIKEADSNNDGCVDFDEFLAMMRASNSRRVHSSLFPAPVRSRLV